MSVAILWDIENVTPKFNSNFITNLLNFLEEKGLKAALKQVFGNWAKEGLQRLAGQLADEGFELVHVPKARKNSADISLITHATETIFLYPHLTLFILVTGDADFRPLLHTLRKQGKDTWIICDARNASEDLLTLADKYFDYRAIEQSQFENDDEPDEPGAPTPPRVSGFSKDMAFDLFEEAVMMLERDKKKATLGSVKVKMKLLNEDFSEQACGYQKWMSFVRDAMKSSAVVFKEGEDEILTLNRGGKAKDIPEVFRLLLEALPTDDSFSLFSVASQNLGKRGVDLTKYGYTRFKKLAIDAEKRSLIETKSEGMNWLLRRKN
jgi:uncharacterized LabA/DUF88 family protein